MDAALVISEAESGARGCEATAFVACGAVSVAISVDILNLRGLVEHQRMQN
jgi:hypothetical protein